MLQTLLNKYYVRYISACAVAFVLLFSSAGSVHAASLSISPESSKVSVGNIISVKILVGTNGKSVNNVDAIVQFPVDLLEVMSVSKGSSVFSLWVEEPKFSNFEGRITLDGGVPTPGYVGQNGEVVSIVFRAKKQGNATVVFGDSAVRQNDGLGTDILTLKQPATIQITSSAQLEVPVVNTNSNSLPAKPVVTSSTHPQQDAWYSATTATFSWIVPSDVTSIQTLLNKNQNAQPTVTYDASVSQRTVNGLIDGVLYFNVRYLNAVGRGPVAHYKIQVDSTPPDRFALIVRDRSVLLNATDALSGIASYLIKVDDVQVARVTKDSLINNEYILPVQNVGDHNLSVIAYDKAGNSTEVHTTFSSSVIVPPVLQVTPDHVQKGDTITIQGKTQYGDSSVEISMQTGDDKVQIYSVKTNSDGLFAYTSEPLNVSGSLNVWARLVFSSSVQSAPSEKVTVQVSDTLIVRTSKSMIYGLSFIIPAILLFLALLFALYYGWHKFFGLKRRINRDVQNTINDIHKTLGLFKEELSNQLNKLERVKEERDLNRKEEKIFKELQNNIDNIDDFIEKKLRKLK